MMVRTMMILMIIMMILMKMKMMVYTLDKLKLKIIT